MSSLNRLSVFSVMLLIFLVSWSQVAVAATNPNPCSEWTCVTSTSVSQVTVAGPTELTIGQAGTWIATATTQPGKQACVSSGESRDCFVTGVTWSISAGDQSNATNTITRSWTTPGTYTVSATGTPVSACCPGSGTSGQISVKVVCVASTVVDKIAYDPEPIKKFFEEACKNAKNCPFVKECKLDITGGGSLELGEICCPGAAYPTPYKKIKIDCKVKGALEAFAPPPFSAVGLVWFNAQTPGWFGDPYVLYSGRLQSNIGFFGGASVDLSILSDEFTISDCGNCLSLKIGANPKLTLGFGGTLNYKIWLSGSIAGNPDFEANLGAEGSASTAVKIEGALKLGSPTSTCKGIITKFCWDGLSCELKAKIAIKGFGSFKFSKTYGPWSGNCE
jgi:hypothetical protein